jgi:hypothetical protein
VLALDQQQDAQIGSEKVQGGLVTQALGQRNGLLQVSTGVFDQPFADIQAVEHVQLAGSEQLVAGLTETGQCLQPDTASLVAGQGGGEIPQQLASQLHVADLAGDRDSLIAQPLHTG